MQEKRAAAQSKSMKPVPKNPSELSGFTSNDDRWGDMRRTQVDPNSMQSNHVSVEYVRQLDKQAMKNCMEQALLRHEKEVSIRQNSKKRDQEQFKQSVD